MQRCRICGCTNNRACITKGRACSWVEKDLCSACAAKTPDKSFKAPWSLLRVPPRAGLEEEWSVMEGKVIIGAFDRKLYAEALIVGRFLVEELARAEGKEIPDLIKEVLETMEKQKK